MCSSFAISRGSAVSDDEVETISRYSRPRYFISLKIDRPVTARSSVPRTSTTNRKQVR